MSGKTSARLNLLVPFCAIASNVLIFLWLVLSSADGDILYVFIAAIISVGLLIIAIFSKDRRRLLTLLTLVVYGAASFVLCRKYNDLRPALRWLLWSKSFKAKVLAQPSDRYNGEWKHIEWDAWGWGGEDTYVYVVYDPYNLLAEAAEAHTSGVVLTPGPRTVHDVRRLEKSWYSVAFGTDTTWERN